MGKLALAAKITHVPSMYLSELPGPRQIPPVGHRWPPEISRRCRELGVDTIVVFDTHWLVNANYHINCAPHFEGLYTSNELPHFIANMPYAFPGNPALGRVLAETCNALGVETMAHDATTLAPEYGTLVPMRYMNADQHFKVVSVSALCTSHYLNDSARLGWAMRKAVEDHYDGTVAFLASGSLSHRFAQNGQAPEFATKVWSPFTKPSTTAWCACGKTAIGPTSAPCSRNTRSRATAKASCMTPPCCSVPWAGRGTTAKPRSSRPTLAPRALARSTPSSPSRHRMALPFQPPRLRTPLA